MAVSQSQQGMKACQPSPNVQGYRVTRHNGSNYAVHRLVCETFHGPNPGNCTVDHIAKYDGDWERERSDNRACNLRWATLSEQNKNHKKHAVRQDIRSVRVWPANKQREDGVVYDCASSASKALVSPSKRLELLHVKFPTNNQQQLS